MSGDDKWQSAFRKRHRTVFKKAHYLKEQAPDNIRIYILIERGLDGDVYHWNSNPGDQDWPLNGTALVRLNIEFSVLANDL